MSPCCFRANIFYLRNAFGILSISISYPGHSVSFLALHIYLFMIKSLMIPKAELKDRGYFRTKRQTNSKLACDPCLWCSCPCVVSCPMWTCSVSHRSKWWASFLRLGHWKDDSHHCMQEFSPSLSEALVEIRSLGKRQPHKEIKRCGQSLPHGTDDPGETPHVPDWQQLRPHRVLENVDLRTTEYTCVP